MWGSLNLQGLILISSKKLLLAESDKAIFSLILPSPALAELSFLSLGIHWVITTACIHCLKYLPNRCGVMHGGSEKWSDSIFCSFSLLGESFPRFLLGMCPSALCGAAPSMHQVYKDQSFHFFLTALWCLFLAEICSFVPRALESSWCWTDPTPRNSPEILYRFLRDFEHILFGFFFPAASPMHQVATHLF